MKILPKSRLSLDKEVPIKFRKSSGTALAEVCALRVLLCPPYFRLRQCWIITIDRDLTELRFNY